MQSTEGSVTRRPNVIVILVDDQGYGDLSSHGHPWGRTPNIDALAAESVRLTDFHSYPMCTPTRGSLLTGLDAMRHQAMNVSSGRTMLSTEWPTLPELLSDSGYRTGLFGKWHLGDSYPYRPQDRGFDRALWFPSSHVSSVPDRWRNDYFDTWFRSESGECRPYDGYCTDILFDQAIEWIGESADQRDPFFAFIPTNAVHEPLLVDQSYREPYLEHGDRLASYWGMLANLDENVGRLDRWLSDRKLADNTLVVYMSDNGGSQLTTSVYNAGMRGAKAQLWEGGHRVPAFFRWSEGGVGGPGRGRDVSTLASVCDFLPTIFDLCDLPTANLQLDGSSIASVLIDDEASPMVRSFVLQFSRMAQPEPIYGDAVVLHDSWRYFPHSGSLYNVATDPGQQRDVGIWQRGVVEELSTRYREWWAALESSRHQMCPLIIGSASEPQTLLSSCEWQDVFLDQQRQVLEATPHNGQWNVYVMRSGRYRLSLRRWPAESGLALDAPAPEHVGGACTFPAGVAMPVAAGRIQVGTLDLTASASEGDAAIEFLVDLHRGPTRIQSWLLDEAGAVLSGAYYLDVAVLDTELTLSGAPSGTAVSPQAAAGPGA